MDISSVNTATPATGITTPSTKAAMPNQTGNVSQASQTDSVSISSEAMQQSRADKYAPKTTIDLFNEWKESGVTHLTIQLPVLPNQPKNENLLPENQQLIDALKEKMKHTSDNNERVLISNKIDLMHAIGDKELFRSEAEIDRRYDAINDSLHLQQRYLTEKYGNPWGEEPLEDMVVIDSFPNDLPGLSELTGKTFSSEPPPEVAALFEPKGYDLAKFNEEDFLMGLLDERDEVDAVVSKRHEEIMNDFNHPYWEESLKPQYWENISKRPVVRQF